MGVLGRLLVVFFLILVSAAVGQLEINEMMYDPGQCSDSECEWIELYNAGNEAINLSGCILNDEELEGVLEEGEFLVVARDEEEFSHHFESPGKIIERSISLKNSGEEIRAEGNCNIAFDYTVYISLAGGNNKTLEKNKVGDWKESLYDGGTPGKQNSIYDFSSDYSTLQITEIMPDPFGDDDRSKPLGEWVEIYNPGPEPTYLGGLVLYDEEDDHELYLADSNTDNLELCGGCYTIVYRDGDSDFDLSKTEDKVRLYTGYPLSNSTFIDDLIFSNAVEGMSFSVFKEGWFQAEPTPGKENVYSGWCDWGIDVAMSNAIVSSDPAFIVQVNRLVGIAQEITVRGKIEDLFGQEISDYKPWTNDKVTTFATKEYSPNLKEGVYQISFWLENITCSDSDATNNAIKKLIAINPQYQKDASSLAIETLYLGSDDSVQWGDQFTTKIIVYKGEDTKTSVQVWAEKDDLKISKTTKINVGDNYKTYPVTVPIQLTPNCDNAIHDGGATLIVEGLDQQEKEEFLIRGVDAEICKDYSKFMNREQRENQRNIVGATIPYEIIELPPAVAPGDLFRAKLKIANEDEEHGYSIFSYVFRGNKCYSCSDSSAEREINIQEVRLKPNEIKIIDFLLKVDDGVKEGEYKVKIKINKDNQKTPKELTESIYVLENSSLSELDSPLVTFASGAVEDNVVITAGKREIVPQSGVTIYESNVEKAKGLVSYVLISVLALLSLSLVLWKKERNT